MLRCRVSPPIGVRTASWRPLPDGLPEAVQLNRSGVSGLSKPAQGGVTTIGTFNYFAGDDPTGPVFLAASWKKQARTLKGDFHFGYRTAIEGISDHVIFPSRAPPWITAAT